MPKTQIDNAAAKAIEEIIKRGNEAIVKRKSDGGYVVIEQKKTIKYSTQ